MFLKHCGTNLISVTPMPPPLRARSRVRSISYDDLTCVLQRSDLLCSHQPFPLRRISSGPARRDRNVLGDLASVLDEVAPILMPPTTNRAGTQFSYSNRRTIPEEPRTIRQSVADQCAIRLVEPLSFHSTMWTNRSLNVT